MNVLLVGSGAREHTIAWKLAQSPLLGQLFVAPGNAGTAAIAENLPIAANDIEGLAAAARDRRIDLVVVGPEEPLARGLVDRLTAAGIPAFGPSGAAAEIESSKVFSKTLMQSHGIPTAAFGTFDSFDEAAAFVRAHQGPLVVKADGLAAGKGAVVTSSKEEALATLEEMLLRSVFGDAGRRVVVEERLQGREVSAHAFTDGRAVVSMPLSCDHKPVFDGDQGPNTGGMGAYSPPHWLDRATEEWIDQHVTRATVQAMSKEGRPYRGVLYPGLMMTADGPRVLEYNCRFGDPETQVLLPRLKTDLLEVLQAVANNRLEGTVVEWSEDACVGVVLASGGYPGSYETGFPIEGLDEVDADVQVFHAGTKRREDGVVVTAGGRVLTVVATGATLSAAREKAYRNVRHIRFQGVHYRRDIGATRGEA
jgi:phosphoribosylamine---glycine ligase